MAKDKLVTSGYCLILAANFLLYFAFYLILPVLPFYLTEVFHTGNAAVGVILSCYTIASLCIRPFSGYLLDTLARKPLYLVAYFIFITIFAGYMLAGVLSIFIMLRVVHGLAFGMVTVAGNTIVIDITPSSRRGEAVGYYGLMNNTAMSFGPMIGLFMHDIYSFETIFACSLISGTIGFVAACLVKTPPKQPVKREPISLDRFVLLKGIPAGIALLLLSIPYGMTSTYVAMYAKEIGITLNSGLFFTFMAVGMAVSRMFSGKQVDKGRITQVITLGLYLVCSCFFILSACGPIDENRPGTDKHIVFYGCPPIGSRLRDDVPRLQYAVRKSGPQQPARNSHLYLPDFMGCRHWHRPDSRRLYRTDYLFRYGIFFRSLPHGYLHLLFQSESISSLS